MSENKKSFLLYTDQRAIFDKLSDAEAGKLIKHIFSYTNDEFPECENILLEIAFTSIETQLKRDLVKYKSICNRNRTNGSKGGRPNKKNPKEPKEPNGFSGNPKEPKEANYLVKQLIK